MKSAVKKQGAQFTRVLRLSLCEVWLPSPLVEFRRRAWSIIAWMDSGVMLFRESLPSGPDAYGQSLEALLTQPAAFESVSYVPGAVSVVEAMPLTRRSPKEGGDSEIGGDGDGVVMAKSLSTFVSSGRDIEEVIGALSTETHGHPPPMVYTQGIRLWHVLGDVGATGCIRESSISPNTMTRGINSLDTSSSSVLEEALAGLRVVVYGSVG
ncbi:hypothetical protein Tco_1540699 [Tanacetum coccineum]